MALADINRLVNLEDIKAPVIVDNGHETDNMIGSDNTNVAINKGKPPDVIRKEVRFADETSSEITSGESGNQNPGSGDLASESCEPETTAIVKSGNPVCEPCDLEPEVAPSSDSFDQEPEVAPSSESHDTEIATVAESSDPVSESRDLEPDDASSSDSHDPETAAVVASEPCNLETVTVSESPDFVSELCDPETATVAESSDPVSEQCDPETATVSESPDPVSEKCDPETAVSEPAILPSELFESEQIVPEPVTLCEVSIYQETTAIESPVKDSGLDTVPIVEAFDPAREQCEMVTEADVESLNTELVDKAAEQSPEPPKDLINQLSKSAVDQHTEPSNPLPVLQETPGLADETFSERSKNEMPCDPLSILTPEPTHDGGSSADRESESKSESESETETTEGNKCCPHAHQFVHDLSEEVDSEEKESVPDMQQLRKERRQRKRKKKQQRLQKCCSGCDAQGAISPITPDLPEPIGLSTGMMQCNVVKTFDEIVQTRYDSEEELDAAIKSYSTVGGRLANQHEQTFSDVDIAGYKSRSECGSPESDPDLLVCDYSNSVGRKLANRNLNKNDDLDECIGGFLLDSLNQNLDPKSRLLAMKTDELNNLVKTLETKLLNVNEELVSVIRENDELKAEKVIISKHISQLTRLVQGHKANDNSAFRKILVTRETDI